MAKSSPKPPAFLCYAADGLSDTQHLSTQMFGAYWRLVLTAWRGIAGLPQCYLPANDEQLARIVGLSLRRWLEMKEEVLKLLTPAPEIGGYSSKRLLAELERFRDKSKKSKENIGKRWQRAREEAQEGDEDEMAKLAERSESMREELSRNPNPASVTVGAEPQNDLERAAFKKLRAEVRSMVKNLTLPEELRSDILDEIKGLTTVTELRATEFAAKQTAARFALDAANEKAAAGQ